MCSFASFRQTIEVRCWRIEPMGVDESACTGVLFDSGMGSVRRRNGGDTVTIEAVVPCCPSTWHRACPVDGQHVWFPVLSRPATEDGWSDTQEESSPMDEVPYGTLDLMVLRTLHALGPQHGYGIARRIEQVAQGTLSLNQGTIYPALLRLEQKGWIASEWGTSENNRRARFYSITRAGRRQLAVEAELWARTVAMMNRLLEDPS
jgi:transcriptional regulator